ncbi:hypothetical protein Y032_0084g1732 [Ancylostoma ceylanicum]|uniref:Uncharacterized protein n=1 Tax=Ancylostoma ceylanicum TaxID=53326 RepID=A0A016TQW1_9BILA|nr:hypothetical protein Y032_0084g1732 [Ancylostoma ceylanicum]
MNFCRLLYLYLLVTVGVVVAQLGLGGLYGNPYAIGGPLGMGGFPGGFGMGYNPMLNNPYGYGSYYDYRCRNLLNGYAYNPLFSGMLGKK